MTRRKIIHIDEEKCNGCGKCVPNCPEGAIQIIDGKARLISDLFCDGLGACIGECPLGAITVEEREAEPFNETKVMENIYPQGKNVIIAHLEHLREHGENEYLEEAIEFLKKKNFDVPEKFLSPVGPSGGHGGCPGMKAMDFPDNETSEKVPSGNQPSALRQWPVQLHLVSPSASYFRKRDVLLSADCVAYSVGSFHSDFLRGKALAIACPKLDSGKEVYVEKIRRMVDEAEINTLTVMIMQVPCCNGLMAIARKALSEAERKIPLKKIVVSVQGDIISEEWV